MSGRNRSGESMPSPSPVPSVASAGATVATVAGMAASLAACLRRDMCGARRKETAMARVRAVRGREVAGTKAETILKEEIPTVTGMQRR